MSRLVITVYVGNVSSERMIPSSISQSNRILCRYPKEHTRFFTGKFYYFLYKKIFITDLQKSNTKSFTFEKTQAKQTSLRIIF